MGGRWFAETRSFLTKKSLCCKRGLNHGDGGGISSQAQQLRQLLSNCWRVPILVPAINDVIADCRYANGAAA